MNQQNEKPWPEVGAQLLKDMQTLTHTVTQHEINAAKRETTRVDEMGAVRLEISELRGELGTHKAKTGILAAVGSALVTIATIAAAWILGINKGG